MSVIKSASRVFSHKTDNSVYIKVASTSRYNQFLQVGEINFVVGLPESLCDGVLLPLDKNNLITGDLMNDASNIEVQNVFTKYVPHRNLSCVYLVQNLFIQGRKQTCHNRHLS